MFRKTKRIVVSFLDEMAKKNIAAYASSTAFFFFMSLVPVLVIFFMILTLSPVTKEDVLGLLLPLIPEEFSGAVRMILTSVYERSIGILPIAILASLWSAGSGTMAIRRGLNTIFRVKNQKNYFLTRLFASVYVLLLMIVLIIFLILMGFSNQIFHLIVSMVPEAEVLMNLVMPLRFVVVIVLLFFLFAITYTILPAKKQRFLEQLPGALFASLSWCVFYYGFSVYLEYADYSVYGSFASIVVLLLWLYMVMYLFLLGACINQYFSPANREFLRVRNERRQAEKKEIDKSKENQ